MQQNDSKSNEIVTRISRGILLAALSATLLTPMVAFTGKTKAPAHPAKVAASAPATRIANRSLAGLSTGVSDSQTALEIRGQSRNLSMLLILKNRHENIDFVKPRDSYKEEIAKTGF